MKFGTPNLGGPLVTRGGLVFIGAAFDRYLRAFDARTGDELWTGRLPAAGVATPMSYEWEGRQYVVITAGGRADAPVPIGDSIVAFALPRPGDPGPSLLEKILDRPGGRFEAGAALAVLALALVIWAVGRFRAFRRKRRQADNAARPP
jgi:quinoprotein glucose dehydrogenase